MNTKNKWCVADSETLRTIENGRRIFLLSFYSSKVQEVHEVWNNQESIIDLLLRFKYVYFHNLSYDGNFIIKLLQKMGFKQKEELQKLDANYYDAIMIGSKIYKITIKYNDKIVNLIDSANFLRSKVKDMNKAYGLGDGFNKTWKGRGYDEQWMYDYCWNGIYSKELEAFKDYCLQDAKIVYYAMMKLFEFTSQFELDIRKYNTISSYAYDLYKSMNSYCANLTNLDVINFKDIEIPLVGLNSSYNLIRSVYKGGFCDLNDNYAYKEWTTKDDVRSYDINSAYPAILNNDKLPCSFMPLVGLEEVTKLIIFYVVDELKAKTVLRFLFNDEFKIKGDDNSHPGLFLKGSIFCLYEEEFKWMKKYYDGNIKVIKEIPLYGCKMDLGGYVKKFYAMKKQYKADGNKGFETLTKLFINAVTGKFGQKPTYKNRVTFSNENTKHIWKQEKVSDKYWIRKDEKVNLKDSMDDSFYVSKKYYEEDTINLFINQEINNFLIVSYITMKTRCKIIGFIDAIGINRWIYSDTDSLKIIGTLDDEKIVGKELGQFKDEGQSYIAMFYHPKAYYWNGEFTFAGVDKDATKNINYKNIKDGYVIRSGKKIPKPVKDGIELEDIDYVVGEKYVF